MRVLIVAVAVAVLAGPAVGEELKPFSFKNLTSSLTMAQALQEGALETRRPSWPCPVITLNNLPTKWCSPSDAWKEGGISGENVYGTHVIGFDDQGVVYYAGDMNSGSFPIVDAAFEAKYGPPCNTSTNEVQNGYGAVFRQDVHEWCFAEGVLSLFSVSPHKVGRSAVQYIDRRYEKTVPAKPVVNF